MSDYVPVNTDQFAFTSTASAGITGGQLVEVTGTGTVGPSAGTARPVGVAAADVGSGQRVTVYNLPGLVHEVLIKSASVIAAGAPVVAASGAPGQIDTGTLATVAAAGTLLGVALTGGTGNGTTVKARFIGV